MKKLALLFCGLGSMLAISMSAANYTTAQPEPQYQEQCAPVNCVPDTCNQLPCNLPVVPCDQPVPNNANNNLPCAPDTVCNPAPCVTPVTNPAPAPTTSGYNGCC